MALKILPHGRLQEWVAEEQGYFAAEGLEYTFLPEGDYGVPAGPAKYRHQVDVRTFGTGERIVFLPYTREVFARLTGSRCGFSPAGPGPAHDIIADRRRRSRSGRVHEHEEMTGLAGRSGGQYSFLNAK